MSNKLEKIVIVGGGTAGWMVAACLSRVLQKTQCEITLIESPEVNTVAVGEATIPPILDFIELLGIDQRDFIQQTQATFKLAIKFDNWLTPGHSYWHQFGSVGADIDGLPFYQHLLKSQLGGNSLNFTDFSPSIAMAKERKFAMIPNDGKSVMSGGKYALHFDATLVARYLCGYSKHHGVKYISAHVERATLNEKGFIDAVILRDGEKITGDFFVDCTGFKALLIEETLHTGYEDWSGFLPCDSAVVGQTDNGIGVPTPYTRASALESGWQWRIPLQHRAGNGYVFCSQYSSDERAIELFKQNLEGTLLTEPRFLRFKTGKRKKIWNKNCLAIGLASGFLEPLESTSIHLIMKAITKFSQMLPTKNCDEVTVNEFNRVLGNEYECIRDFIILHYCTTKRDDSDFWRYCKNMAIPDSLATKLALFRSQGRLYKNEFDLFADNSWYAVLEGMGVRPGDYDPLVDLSDARKVNALLQSAVESLSVAAKKLPNHDEFYRLNCPAPAM